MSRDLGSKIRRLRRDRGLTQAQLGGSRLSESYISLIESGRRTPSREVVEYLAEVFGYDPDILTGESNLPDAATAEMLIRRGEWETNSGQPLAAIEHLEEGLELATRLADQTLAVRAQVALARALEVGGQLAAAVTAWEQLWAESQRDPQYIPTGAVTVGLSRCCRELGDLDRAVEVGESYWTTVESDPTLDIAATEDAVVVGATLLSAYLEMGNNERCRQLAAELVQLAETIDTPMATGAAYWNAALAAEADGRIGDALRLAEQAQARMALTQDVRNKARLQVVLGGLQLRTHPPDTEAAFRLLIAAEPVLRQFGSTVDSGYCLTELARAYLQSGDFVQARTLATSTIEDLERFGEAPIEVARTLMVLAAAESGLGKTDTARAHARRAADLLEHAGATRQAASRWTELAELSVELGDLTGAIEAFRKATDLLGARQTAGTPQAGDNQPLRTQVEAS